MGGGGPIAWERVLVRHVVAAKRNDVWRLSPVLRVPFADRSSLTCDDDERDLSSLRPQSGRWMLAPRFAGESWIPLFSNGADGKKLFEANAESRRLEVAWIGCRPGGDGWFFQLRRAGKPIVEFSQSTKAGSSPTFRATGLDPGLLAGLTAVEDAFKRLCDSFEISLPMREVHATGGKFLVIGARGKPVRTALRGYVFFAGPKVAAGEDAAADALAGAIDRCDPGGIREAIALGASPTTLPDTSVSPLLMMLYQQSKCDQQRWEGCLDALLAAGCPIGGSPGEEPPLFGCVVRFIPDGRQLRMAEFLISRGADVDATNLDGETALLAAAVEGDLELVRLLRRRGADPNIKTARGDTAIDRIRQIIRNRMEAEDESHYAMILDLLTSDPPG